MRIIKVIGAHARSVRVYLADGEYIARLYIQGAHYPAADYFTDDKTDALQTAAAMLARG